MNKNQDGLQDIVEDIVEKAAFWHMQRLYPLKKQRKINISNV